MKKNIIATLLETEITRPIKREDVIELVERLPQLAIKRSKKERVDVEVAIASIQDEIISFAEKLDEAECEVFLDFLECEMSERADVERAKEDNVSIMNPETDKWGFYIRFKISKALGIDQVSLLFLDKFIIESDSDVSLKDAKILKLRNLEGLIYRDIIEVSKKVEQALILAFAELGIGIAYPDNLASEAPQEIIKKELENNFIERHTKRYDSYTERPLIHWSDKFGVVLFPEESVPWDTRATQDNSSVDPIKFQELFNDNYGYLERIFFVGDKFKKIEIAAGILTTSLFDDSLINKIILSMTAIEVLSEKAARPDEELMALTYLAQKLDEADFSDSTKKSLAQSLESIRFQSIGKACRTLVKEFLGKKDAEKFHDLYAYRSQLVHAGALKDGREKMYKTYIDSYDLVTRLLAAYVRNASKNQAPY